MLAVSTLFALSSCGENGGKRLVIIHVNDTHSHFEPVRGGDDDGRGGLVERAAFIDSVRAAVGEENVLLLHAGDFSQGTSYFPLLKGDLEIEAINALGYDAVALGNHEFDNGLEDLARRLSALKCPVLCANYDFTPFEAGKYVKPYTIVEKAGLRIGIFGLLTDILQTVERSVSSRLPKFGDVETANYWASWLHEQEGCDMVIALTHLGFEGEAFNDPELVAQCRGIDLVVGGHSHTFLEKVEYAVDLDGRKVPIVQNGCWGLNMGEITIYLPEE